MTYKELVDTLKDIAFRHNMIVDFGYGEISDIKVKSQDEVNNDEADYPYMFLNPGQHTRTQNSINYNFNLIMMDMAKDDDSNSDVLRIQSECAQYIDDVLSELYFNLDTLDVNLSVSLTPFKERFQDSVAGMTATLNIVVPQGLNRCIAPFEPAYTQQVYVYATQDRINDPDAESQTYKFDVIAENDGGYTAGVGQGNRYYPQSAGTWKFVLEGQWKLNEPGTISQGPVLYHQAPFQVHYPDTLTGWPTSFESVDTVYNVRAEWILEHPGEGEYEIAALYNDVGIEAEMTVLSGLTYRIYKANE